MSIPTRRPPVRPPRLARLLVAAVLATGLTGALAQEVPTYDRVQFQVVADREVEPDLALATLAAEREAGQQSAAADQVNRAMRWALDRAREVQGVETRTTGYRTIPVYRNQAIVAWRVRQQLRLESRDASALAGLVSTLQEQLALEGLEQDVALETRRAAEGALIEQALAAFQTRAELVAKSLGRTEYRLVRIDIGTDAGVPPRPEMLVRATAMKSMAVAEPVMEAGTRRLTATASGEIELVRAR
ncbi:MAG: SIMPL domain-containing protein [Ectothiorhodospiraceae bacterium]|nr:SIMPL domain-containing protein [Chromatiales bacterium]MCP5156721.1 SIMPL domain-containing protein [Ectothiorhodospiraceae bacterium]